MLLSSLTVACTSDLGPAPVSPGLGQGDPFDGGVADTGPDAANWGDAGGPIPDAGVDGGDGSLDECPDPHEPNNTSSSAAEPWAPFDVNAHRKFTSEETPMCVQYHDTEWYRIDVVNASANNQPTVRVRFDGDKFTDYEGDLFFHCTDDRAGSVVSLKVQCNEGNKRTEGNGCNQLRQRGSWVIEAKVACQTGKLNPFQKPAKNNVIGLFRLRSLSENMPAHPASFSVHVQR